MPLQQPLRVGERAVFLDVRRRRKEEDLRSDLTRIQLAAHHLGRIAPEGGRLGLDHVAHDEPFQLAQRHALELRVRRADRGILSHHEQTVELSVGHVEPVSEVRVIAGELRQPSESEIIFFRRRFAVVRLEQADDVLVDVVPPAGRAFVVLEICGEARFVFLRHRQISGENVEERWDIR